MRILYGIMCGAVLQRNAQEISETVFAAEAIGEIRVVGDLGSVKPLGENRYLLTGLCTGGPYTLTLRDDENEITLTDLYVGDVWMLAGQSNMDGVGYFSEIAADYHPSERIRFLRLNDTEWRIGHPCCHENHLSPHPYMNRYVAPAPAVANPRGVGPGFFFAESMYRRTGVPQGLIPCALGGSGMFQWNPEETAEEGNLYTIAIQRLRLAGGSMRGIFWYQGCSETGPGGDAVFVENMKRMIAAFRREAHNPHLPFVQVQINRFTYPDASADAAWSKIRELQRTLSDHISDLDTVATIGATLADGIHLDGQSQRRLGIAAAESMYYLSFDREGIESLPAPSLDSVRIVSDSRRFGSVLAIRFSGVHGDLTSLGAPDGFALSSKEDCVDLRSIFRTELHGDTVYLYHELPEDRLRTSYLSYFFGNGTYANITDRAGRPIPAFGPLPLSELLS